MTATVIALLTIAAPLLGGAAIAVAAWDQRRVPEPGHVWFVLTLAAFVMAAVPFHPLGYSYEAADNAYGWRIASSLIVLLPTFLLHAVGVLCGRTRSWTLRASDMVGASTVALILLAPTFPGVDYRPLPWYFYVTNAAFTLHFVLALVLAVRQLRRAARAGIGAARVRGHFIAGAVVTFGLSYGLWFLSPTEPVEVAMGVFAMLAGVSFWFAVRAPRGLFGVLDPSLPDPADEVARLMAAGDLHATLPSVLQATIEAWGLSSVAVVDADGSLIEAAGSSRLDSDAARSTRHLRVASSIGGLAVEVTSMSLTPALRRRDREQLVLLATFIELARQQQRARRREHAATLQRQAADAALSVATERLSEASDLRDRFVAIVAQELRDPTARLLGLARDGGTRWEQLPAEQLEPMQQLVARQGERIAAVVERLLLLSSVEHGTLRSRPRELDMVELVRSAARDLGMADDVQIDIGDDDGCVAHGEAVAVREIVTALLENAGRHGRPPIIVRGRCDDELLVEVVDHGTGVRPEFEPRLFERFTRDVEGGVPGTGVGLAVARELARAQQGSVGYRRDDEGRALFWVRLPQATTATP